MRFFLSFSNNGSFRSRCLSQIFFDRLTALRKSTIFFSSVKITSSIPSPFLFRKNLTRILSILIFLFFSFFFTIFFVEHRNYRVLAAIFYFAISCFLFLFFFFNFFSIIFCIDMSISNFEFIHFDEDIIFSCFFVNYMESFFSVRIFFC